MSGTIFENANIFDGTGTPVFPGEVRVEDNRITAVARGASRLPREGMSIIDCRSGTLMPGLVEAHTHLSFPSSVERVVPSFGLPPEESLLISVQHARILLDHGFTSAYSAGTLATRLDVVVRNEIEAGRIPGPRLKACAVEQFPDSMAGLFKADNLTNDSGKEGIRRYVRTAAENGVDIVKFCLSGENQLSPGSSHDVYYSDDEVAAAHQQAKESGVWLSAHAQASGAVKQAVRNGFRVIYHCTFADEEALDLLEERKTDVFMAPAVGVLQGTLECGPVPGVPIADMQRDAKADMQLLKHLIPQLKQRGVRVLPGGDYGFVWNLTGTNARDLEHFVNLFGFTPIEALVAATQYGGQLMGMGNELGLIKDGYLADLLVIAGDPTNDIRLLQRTDQIEVIMKGGAFYKNKLLNEARRAA